MATRKGTPPAVSGSVHSFWLVIFISKKIPDLARTGIVYLFIVRFVR